MTAIGHMYEEPEGVVNLTVKLLDCLPPYTRRFASPGQMYKELMDLRPDLENQAHELYSGRKLTELRGDPKEWSRILLCGPDELTFEVRFRVSNEQYGPILTCGQARPFVPTTFDNEAGVRFESVALLVQALDCVGLPGKEIRSSAEKVYSVTRAQLRTLHLGIAHG